MEPKKILLTTDFSPLADEALEPAASLAERFGVPLVLVSVVPGRRPPKPDPTAPYFKAAQALYDNDVEAEADALRQLEERLRPLTQVSWQAIVGRGEPIKSILDIAEKEDVGLIVISSQGRTGLKRMILGSVAEELARVSPLPVLIWKGPRA
ncbi:MAG: universal stress protein [Planctomycetota bacterium]